MKSVRVGQLLPVSGSPKSLQLWTSYASPGYMGAILEALSVLRTRHDRNGGHLHNSRTLLSYLHFCHIPLVLPLLLVIWIS